MKSESAGCFAPYAIGYLRMNKEIKKTLIEFNELYKKKPPAKTQAERIWNGEANRLAWKLVIQTNPVGLKHDREIKVHQKPYTVTYTFGES